MADDESGIFMKPFQALTNSFNRWYENVKESNKKMKGKEWNPSFKTSFAHLFPNVNDLPEVREEKFANLAEIWTPKTDLTALTSGHYIAMGCASFAQLPFLVTVRKLLKVMAYNRVMAVTSSMALAAGSAATMTNNQLNQIIRGEVDCTECHLIRTGAYQFVFASLFPSFSAILVSTFSALANPGIVLPIDVLERWSSLKCGLSIIAKSLYKPSLIIGFVAVATVNVAVGVGIVYHAMKEYHDVHKKLLDDRDKKIVI